MTSTRGDVPGHRAVAAGTAPFRAARWALFATFLVPAVVVPGFFFPYVTVRAVYFRVLVEIVVAVVLYLALRRESTVRLRRDPALWMLTAWVAANALAAAFGFAPIRSIFGDHERMAGVWLWLHLLAFYAALRIFVREDDWWRLFRVAVAIAVAITLYGLAQYQYRFFAAGVPGVYFGVTIGNPGLLGAYLLANVSLAAMLAVRARGVLRLLYVAAALVLITGQLFSGNRSSLLGLIFGVGVAIAAYLLSARSARPRTVLLIGALFAAVAALPFVVAARWGSAVSNSLPAISRLAGGVDRVRVIQWQAAIEAIRERPLFGVGPENYPIVWSQFYHPEMHRLTGDTQWDRAHNAYLDAFATSGVLGFLALLGVCVAFGWMTVVGAKASRARQVPENGPVVEAIVLGFFGAYALYLFFWFFDLNSTMLWIALAAFVTTRAVGAPLAEFGPARAKRWQTSLVLGAGALAFAAVIYVHGFETLRMARALDQVRDRGRQPEEILRGYEDVFDSPAPITQHVFPMYASHLASLRPHFQQMRNDPVGAALFDRSFILAIEEFEKQAQRDPQNERVTVQHARVLMLAASYYDNPRLYESALRRLHRAVELAPRRIPTRLALGMAYLNIQRPREALAEFEKAYVLYPPHGQTQAYLGLAFASLGEYGTAAGWLKAARYAGYELNPTILTGVATGAAASGDETLGGDLLQDYLTSRYGPRSLWQLFPLGNGADYRLAVLASDLFQRGGAAATATALATAAPALCERPLALPALATSGLNPASVRQPDCRQPWRRPVP